jgi:glutamyl-tRNA reductase
LSQLTDETLENRKKHIPAAEAIIEEIKEEFIVDQRENCPNHSRFESQVKCDKSIGTGFSKQENFQLQ